MKCRVIFSCTGCLGGKNQTWQHGQGMCTLQRAYFAHRGCICFSIPPESKRDLRLFRHTSPGVIVLTGRPKATSVKFQERGVHIPLSSTSGRNSRTGLNTGCCSGTRLSSWNKIWRDFGVTLQRLCQGIQSVCVCSHPCTRGFFIWKMVRSFPATSKVTSSLHWKCSLLFSSKPGGSLPHGPRAGTASFGRFASWEREHSIKFPKRWVPSTTALALTKP